MELLSAVANLEVNWWVPIGDWHSNPGLNELLTNAYWMCGDMSGYDLKGICSADLS